MSDDNSDSDSDNNSQSDSDFENGIEINEKLYQSIKNTFEEELFKIFKKIVSKYGDSYIFSYEDLINFYKQYNIKSSYKISPIPKNKSKNETQIEIKDEERCCARIWSGGYMNKKTKHYGDRCQRKKINDSDYCRQHLENLTHGRFDEEPSKIVKGFFIKENSYY